MNVSIPLEYVRVQPYVSPKMQLSHQRAAKVDVYVGETWRSIGHLPPPRPTEGCSRGIAARGPSPSESPRRLGVAGSIIDPAYDAPIHKRDINAVPTIAVLIAMRGKFQGGAEIRPVRGQASVSGYRVWLSPYKEQRIGAHAWPGPTMPDGFLVMWIEYLEALSEADLPERGRALGRSCFGEIRTLLRPGHNFPVEEKL
jgi:hypothetical protein